MDAVAADRLAVRPAGDGPLGRALRAARERLHGAAAGGTGTPVVVELDDGPVASAVLDGRRVERLWLPTHLRGTELARSVVAALDRAAGVS